MSKKSQRPKNRAVFLVALEKMTDEEVTNLGLAMPPNDPRFPAVYFESKKRLGKQMQELLDKASSPEVREAMEYAMDPETFEQFLDETPEAKAAFHQVVAGDEDVTDHLITAINEKRAAQN